MARLKRIQRPETEQHLRVVYCSQGFAEAEIVRSFLESNGIKSVFKGAGAQSILPQTNSRMGAIKVCVLEKDLHLAEELLRKLEKPRDKKE
jgi:hypothetical protein